MSAPLVPSPLDYIGRRHFCLFPVIRDFEPNEWKLGSGSWNEVQIVNCQTGHEFWISRQYIGGISETSESYLVVNLTKELEFRAGTLTPRVRRVIEMPVVQLSSSKPLRKEPERRPIGPATVVGIRLEPPKARPATKTILLLAITAVVISLLLALWSGMFTF
jgi:hypothetical protein